MSRNILYGFHAVYAAVQHKAKQLIEIFIQSDRDDERMRRLITAVNIAKLALKTVTKQQLTELCGSDKHQGVAAFYNHSLEYTEADLPELLGYLTEPTFLLILDGVRDPHNLGACLRSANAAGVHAVIAPKDKAVGLTPVVRKVASGAAELTPFIQVTNLARTMRWLREQGIWLFGLAEEGSSSLYQTQLNGNIALVCGAEGHGLRRLTREHCDTLVNIPTVGTVSSLNVSVAAGVSLFEALRQRQIGHI